LVLHGTDSGCDARYDAQALREAGLPDVAISRLCQKPEIAKAMAAAGKICPSDIKVTKAESSTIVSKLSIDRDLGDAKIVSNETYTGK